VLTTSFRRVGIATVLLYSAIVLSMILSGRVLPGTGIVGATTGPTTAQWTCTGTKFFNSAGLGATFTTGTTHNGGTFTVENNNYMEVRDNPESGAMGYIVGEFEQPKVLGDTTTIVFDRTIHIVSVYWWDNDPKTGEAGWSFNGVPGPVTGEKVSAITAVNYVTNTVTISAGDDSGGVDFCYIEVSNGTQGCTPGYWKQSHHFDSWVGYTPTQTLESVFDVPDSLNKDNVSLVTALNGGGGPGVAGASSILLRAAVASLLNAANPGVDFTMTTAEVIAAVNAALASNDRATILALAASLDADNNLGCPLN
jgi:hypothetical protein